MSDAQFGQVGQSQGKLAQSAIALEPARQPHLLGGQTASGRWALLVARPLYGRVASLVIFALSLGVCLYQAYPNSVWLDEAYAVGLSQLGWSTLWSYLWGIEAHMGFYYVLLRGWIWLLGLVGVAPTELAVRIPSLLFVALSAVIVYQFGRRFLSETTGVLGALLYLMNFLVLTQGDEAREYGLQLLLVCASWYALVGALSSADVSWRWWTLYLVCGTLQLYAEVYGLLILAAQVVTFICLLGLGPRWRAQARRSALVMITSVACILALASPVLYDALLHGSGTEWIPPAQLSDLVALFSPLGGGVELFVSLLLAIGLVELVVALLARAPQASWRAGASARLNQWLGATAPALLPAERPSPVALAVSALVCWFALPILLAYFLTQPALNLHLFNYQFLAICAPAYCLLAGVCVAVTRWRFVQVVLAIVLVAFSLRVLPTAQSSANYGAWHAPALWLEQRYAPGDGIVCAPDTWCAITLEYYLFAYHSQAQLDADSPGAWNWVSQTSNPTTPDALASYAAEHDRVFVVTYDRSDFGAASAQDLQIEAVKNWFNDHDWQAESFTTTTYLSTITVTMYVPQPSPSALPAPPHTSLSASYAALRAGRQLAARVGAPQW